MLEITLDNYKCINNSRLLKIGVKNPLFSVIEGLTDYVYNNIKTGDEIIVNTLEGKILCIAKFKYRDARDIKIYIKGKIE